MKELKVTLKSLGDNCGEKSGNLRQTWPKIGLFNFEKYEVSV